MYNETNMELWGGGNLSQSPFLESLSKIHVAGLTSRWGFTLAEVLITLGIIGIVAALTIPALISKYNEIVTITALKKTYSELAQAIKMSEAVNGDLRYWDWPNNSNQTNDFVKQYILPYLSKNVTYCKFGNKCFKDDYFWKNPDGTYNTAGYFQIPYARYKYNDKTIAFAAQATPCTSSDNGYMTCSDRIRYLEIAVDVNGDRGRSIMGKDVFLFTLFNYTYKTRSGPSGENYGLHLGSIAGYWGAFRQPLENMFQGNPGNCKVNGSGYDCGLAIQKNGWKIPKQYPIKF